MSRCARLVQSAPVAGLPLVRSSRHPTSSSLRPRHECTEPSPVREFEAASAVEHEPAQFVAQPLIVEHEIPDLSGKLGTLPTALQTTGLLAIVLPSRLPRGPDRVGRGSEFVGRHVRNRGGLAGGVPGMPCCPTQVPGRAVRMARPPYEPGSW